MWWSDSMKVCLSFDDGRIDSFFTAYKALKNSKLTASFHITTGFVDFTYISNDFGNGRKPLTKDNLLEMHGNNMDISSHGDRHIMDANDFSTSIKKLSSWGIKKPKYGFSIPNSKYCSDELKLFYDGNKKDILYIRGGRNPSCYSFKSKINYVLYKLFHFYRCYKQFNEPNLLNSINKDLLFSLVVKKHTKVSDLIRFIDDYKETDKTLILMFHSIVENPTDDWEWGEASFMKLCSFLANNKSIIETLSIEELVKNEKK